MAASSAAVAAACGSAAVPAAARGDASRLSAGNAFRTTSMVHFAPLRTMRSNKGVAARAALSEDSTQKSVQRDIVVSIIAAGAALGLSVSAVDGAFANPLDVARSKFASTLNSAKNAAPTLPSAPNVGGAVEDAKKAAENVASSIPAVPNPEGVIENAKKGLPDVPKPGETVDTAKKVGNVASDGKGQVDGVFGKDGGLFGQKGVASTNGGTGSALGDAGKRISSFGKNPIADNLEKGSEQTVKNIASASPKPQAQRVDEATEKVNQLGSDLQNKGSDAIAEGKSFFGDKAQGSVPQFPDLTQKLPEIPSLPTPDTSIFEELKSGVQSKVEEAKSFAGSALPQ